MGQKPIIISQGKLPIWKAVLATLCFMIALLVIVSDVIEIYRSGSEKVLINCSKSVGSIIQFAAFGILLAVRRTIRIDPEKKLLYTDFCVGPFIKTRTTIAPELEYVSVFKNGKMVYEANLWYTGNKHYKMCVFEDEKSAFLFARKIAQKLNIDLLDATRKGDFTWIEMNETNA